jgi:hypothetical protein
MMKRIKTIIVLIFAVMLLTFYSTGCFPGGVDLLSMDAEARSLSENRY